MSAIVSNGNVRENAPVVPTMKSRKNIFGKEFERIKIPQHMGKLLNYALSDLLLQYPNTLIFGEDVAKKGGVYHITADLYKQFGERRFSL